MISVSSPSTLIGLILLLIQPNTLWADWAENVIDDDLLPQHTAQVTLDSIQISVAKQATAGLKTLVISKSDYVPESQVTAKVLDIQPLLTLREQYFTALIEYQSAQAALQLAQQSQTRSQSLYQNGIHSQKQVQDQQLILNAATARLNASHYHLQSMDDALTVSWGKTLSTWAKNRNNPNINDFINGRHALLLVSLPSGQSLPKVPGQIAIDPNGDRDDSQIAEFISSAAQSSDLSQGETYFYKTSHAKLRTGMHLSAWVNQPEKPLSGYVFPTTSIIWHAGLPTVFLKIASDQFKQFPLPHYFPVAQGYFVNTGMPKHPEVVITGAQLLLSHTLKALIPTEDDGDD